MPSISPRFLGFLLPILLLATLPGPARAQDDEIEKLREAGSVFEEMLDIKEQRVPPKLLDEARAVAIIPGVVKAGFVLGGRRGRGVLLVHRDDGSWSAPAFLTITGGSFGLQAGVSSTDVVLVFRNDGSVQSLIDGKVTLGGNVSVAAGPVGRSAEAATDARLKAEVYSYSRSRGAFAGVALEGAALTFSQENNSALYGTGTTVNDILYGATPPPDAAQPLRTLLAKSTS